MVVIKTNKLVRLYTVQTVNTYRLMYTFHYVQKCSSARVYFDRVFSLCLALSGALFVTCDSDQ